MLPDHLLDTIHGIILFKKFTLFITPFYCIIHLENCFQVHLIINPLINEIKGAIKYIYKQQLPANNWNGPKGKLISWQKNERDDGACVKIMTMSQLIGTMT